MNAETMLCRMYVCEGDADYADCLVLMWCVFRLRQPICFVYVFLYAVRRRIRKRQSGSLRTSGLALPHCRQIFTDLNHLVKNVFL